MQLTVMRATVQKRIGNLSIINPKSIHIPFSTNMNSPHQPGCPSAFSRRAGRVPSPSALSSPLLSRRTGVLYGRYSLVSDRLTGYFHSRILANTNIAHPSQNYSYSITAIPSAIPINKPIILFSKDLSRNNTDGILFEERNRQFYSYWKELPEDSKE